MQYGLWQFGGGTGDYRSHSTQTESHIVKRALDHAQKVYGRKRFDATKIHGGGYQASGLPDVYIIIDGISVWVEFKRPGADTTKLQKTRLERLKELGVYCGTASCNADLMQILEDVISEIPDIYL